VKTNHIDKKKRINLLTQILTNIRTQEKEAAEKAAADEKAPAAEKAAADEKTLIDISTANTVGKGNFGIVYKKCCITDAGRFVKDESKGSQYVIKKLDIDPSPFALSTFNNEIEIGAQLKHKNIIKIYTEYPRVDSIILEYIEDDFEMKDNAPNINITDKEDPIKFILEISKQIAEGMEYMHGAPWVVSLEADSDIHGTGFIHCDLAVRNLRYDKVRNLVKIIDFGLTGKINTQLEGGTYPIHQYPWETFHKEMTDNLMKRTSSIDIFSFGCTMIELFSGGFKYIVLAKAQNKKEEAQQKQIVDYIPKYIYGTTEALSVLKRPITTRPNPFVNGMYEKFDPLTIELIKDKFKVAMDKIEFEENEVKIIEFCDKFCKKVGLTHYNRPRTFTEIINLIDGEIIDWNKLYSSVIVTPSANVAAEEIRIEGMISKVDDLLTKTRGLYDEMREYM